MPKKQDKLFSIFESRSGKDAPSLRSLATEQPVSAPLTSQQAGAPNPPYVGSISSPGDGGTEDQLRRSNPDEASAAAIENEDPSKDLWERAVQVLKAREPSLVK